MRGKILLICAMVSAIVAVLSFFIANPGVWETASRGLSGTATALSSALQVSYPIPVWALIASAVVFGLLVIWGGWSAWRLSPRPSSVFPIPMLDMYGVELHWKYVHTYDGAKVVDIAMWCPKCKVNLTLDYPFRCVECDASYDDIPVYYDNFTGYNTLDASTIEKRIMGHLRRLSDAKQKS